MTTIEEHLAAPSEPRPALNPRPVCRPEPVIRTEGGVTTKSLLLSGHGPMPAASHKDVRTPLSRTATPSLTPHARSRAAQMGVPTKHVKRAIQFPDCVYPAGEGRTISVAGALAVVHADGVVITVLWNGREGREGVPFDLRSTTRSLSATGQAA